PDDADHDREGTEPDPEEAGRALWHMWRGVQKQNLDPGLVNEIAMNIVSQATVPVDLVEHLLDTHHNRAAIEMTAVENDALPIGLRERILAGVRYGPTLYFTVGSATLPERLCRAAWEATFHLETGRSGDRETIDTLRA